MKLGFAALAMAALLGGAAPADRFAAGQVWSYKARPQDANSLIKIQRVELVNAQRVFHVAVSAVHLRNGGVTDLPHLPVAEESLEASDIARRNDVFPVGLADTDEGIAEWRRAEGGVFTVPFAEIVEIVDRTLSGGPPASEPAKPRA